MPINQTFVIGNTILIYDGQGNLTTQKSKDKVSLQIRNSNIAEVAFEQLFKISANGLKPNTNHSLFLAEIDVSTSCRPEGGKLGDALVTDDNGQINFEYYFTASIQSISPSPVLLWEQAKSLFTSLKFILLTNSDNSSFAQFPLDTSLTLCKTDWFKILPSGFDDITGAPL